MTTYKRGDIWQADLGKRDGSEQRGKRPVLIIQNDIGNYHSPTVIVASITDAKKRYMPTHVYLSVEASGLDKDSKVLLEQIHTVDKCKLLHRISTLPAHVMYEVDARIKISTGLLLTGVESRLFAPKRERGEMNGS